ncbi:DUF6090 family protein [Formosa maritima]|uniref:DUF6090 family protein n=1 Tax=Formosa maritima TaxID=2592046 RepID=UPI0018F3427B|nr:DUF6090 family protein [Formosa maritima]
MIKFFRKIRFTLMETGKTGKYFKYAIGEIVLVVIGILIALQINDWNENRKNKTLVHNYKISLIEDLAKDSMEIMESIRGTKQDSAAIKNYETRVSKPTATLDTLLKIARYEYDFLIWIHPDFNDDTYSVLSSTGNISLFSEELIKDLNILNNLQETANFSTTQTFVGYVDILRAYSLKYPIPFQSNAIQKDSKIADLIWNNASLVNHATEFNAILLSKGDAYRLSLRHLPLVLEKTNELLTKLRKQ